MGHYNYSEDIVQTNRKLLEVRIKSLTIIKMGTFDVSLLSIEDGVFEVKAVGGNTHLGKQNL